MKKLKCVECFEEITKKEFDENNGYCDECKEEMSNITGS